jgi:hypothetical protein
MPGKRLIFNDLPIDRKITRISKKLQLNVAKNAGMRQHKRIILGKVGWGL